MPIELRLQTYPVLVDTTGFIKGCPVSAQVVIDICLIVINCGE